MNRKLLLLLLPALFSIDAQSQEHYFGLFNSPKGFGVTADFHKPSSNEMTVVNLYADMYGVYSGKAAAPGVKIQGIRERILGNWNFSSGKGVFHTGPGISIGYVRDHSRESTLPQGLELSLMADAGVKFLFDRGYAIDLSLSLELGVFASKTEGDGATVRIYKNGGFQFIMPQLKITRKF